MARLPNDSQRSVIIGRTGSGKTVAGAWQLSQRSIDRIPWIILDFKGDKLLNRLGALDISLTGSLPSKPGLYITHPLPHQIDEVEVFLWKVWKKESIGLFFDEGYMVTGQKSFRAILTQGRSKTIPCIILSQRPVFLDRFAWSEADFFQVFHLNMVDDRKTIKNYIPSGLPSLPEYHSVWYDVSRNQTCILRPVPGELSIVKDVREIQGNGQLRFI